MMLDKFPLLHLYDEDYLLIQVLNNTCTQGAPIEDTVGNFECSLKQLLKTSDLLTPTFLHTLLPHEVKLPSVNEASVREMTKQIEVVTGRQFIINNQLSTQQEQSLREFLQEKKYAFAWDYIDMVGLDPKLCTHIIYTQENTKPIR